MTTVSVQLWHHNHTSSSNSVLSCQIFSEILSFEDFGVDGLQLGRRIYTARVWVSKSFVVALEMIAFHLPGYLLEDFLH